MNRRAGAKNSQVRSAPSELYANPLLAPHPNLDLSGFMRFSGSSVL